MDEEKTLVLYTVRIEYNKDEVRTLITEEVPQDQGKQSLTINL